MVGRTPSVLLVGHSFVRRLKDHASKRGQTLAEAVGIEEVASVHTIYAGGATFERALHPSTSLVVRLRDLKELPEIMCIDLGTNDLCAVGATVNGVVASAIELLDSLRRAHLMPKHLVFMGVVQRTAVGCRRGVSAGCRRGVSAKTFNRRARAFNSKMAAVVRSIDDVHTCSLARLNRPDALCVSPDGCHLSDEGYRRYCVALRSTVLQLIK